MCEEALYRGRKKKKKKKKRRLKSDLSRSVKGRDLFLIFFFPLFPLQPCLVGGEFETPRQRGGRRNFFQDHIVLENLGGLHHGSFFFF